MGKCNLIVRMLKIGRGLQSTEIVLFFFMINYSWVLIIPCEIFQCTLQYYLLRNAQHVL